MSNQHERALSKSSNDDINLSIESGSLEQLIKIALKEFDENGCVVSPPSVTIVLLTMHGWYVTPKEFLAKIIKIYESQFGSSDVLSNDDELSDDSDVFGSSQLLEIPENSPRLTSIVETNELNDDNDQSITPEVPVNDAEDTMKDEYVTKPEGLLQEVTSQITSTDATQVKTCVADHVKVGYSDAVSEIPKLKVTFDDKESPEEQDSPILDDHSVHKSDDESSKVISSSANDSEDPPVNMWILCQFLHYWLSKFSSQLRAEDSILRDIAQLKKRLIRQNPRCEKGIKKLIGRTALGAADHIHSTRLIRQKEVARTKSLAFNDLTPKDIADQLTHIDCRSLKKIPMSEWKTYARKPKLSTVPCLQKYVGVFNGLSRWIEAMVLKGENPAMRAHIIEKFLNVAQCLRSHQNFNSLMAVVGALNHSALRRLHDTMAVLSENKRKFLEEMTEFLSSEGNYSKYRRELMKCSGFYVPILGVHLKDLVAVDAALPDYVTEEKLINFQKMVKFYAVIATLMNFKNMLPPAPSKYELINMLRVSIQMTISEDELYELSYAKEPRKSTTLPRVTTTANSELFADWASGRVASPDSKTIDKHVASMVEAVFKFYDRDSDGRLTTEDFEAISTNFPFIDAFGVVDANSDGVVTKEEMKAYFLKANFRALGRDFVHNFQETTYLTRSYCEHCGGVLWGLIRQGLKCKDCGITVHKSCKDQVVVDCHTRRSSVLSNSSATAAKAEAVRNRLKNKRKSRLIVEETENLLPRRSISVDDVDAVNDEPKKNGETNQGNLELIEENKRLKRENEKLNNDLNEEVEKVRNLESQLKSVRQETMMYVLAQLDALQLRRNTAV
ncbi:ras guanyl-releasing protein 3-like [Xenia sp. Carnegie-2017]|uniref:ras guanyl-releasing protein 3-like n=1 Tax=Xenia sp. Carnegie-2017 TaxID=2897299 RepID=UPI001F0504FF|nr:ras guanyl-releasing protein 3-like [Xenia sp. Carnegie-2017]